METKGQQAPSLADDGVDESPFIIGTIVKDPSRFWGRRREIRDVLARVQKMESTSIIGPRRIGKSSLVYFVYSTGPMRLGSDYELVWLNAQSNHTLSVDHFFRAVACRSSLVYESSDDPHERLIRFENAVKGHSKKLVLIINEFELLTERERESEFDRQFYNTLRLLAEESHCALVIASGAPIKSLCRHVLGLSSPFYNIFSQITLQCFTAHEADAFLNGDHMGVFLTSSERTFIRERIRYYRHPLVLQIACDLVFKRRRQAIPDRALVRQIKQQVELFLNHQEVRKGRRMAKRQLEDGRDRGISKSLDLTVSMLIPILGIGILMFEYAMLMRVLDNFQSVLLALVTAILGFGVLIFAGRSIDIVSESTFYKVFIRLVDQIPLLASLADRIIGIADRIKGTSSTNNEE